MKINNHFNNLKTQMTNKTLKGKAMDGELNNFKSMVFPKVCELLNDTAEREVPENGMFRRVLVAYDIPDSQTNEGFLDIAHHPKDKDKRVLSSNVHHKNSDRIFSNIIKIGTKKEIIDYLKNDKNHEELINSALELSQKADEYYSSL